jgi:hypothetical protein
MVFKAPTYPRMGERSLLFLNLFEHGRPQAIRADSREKSDCGPKAGFWAAYLEHACGLCGRKRMSVPRNSIWANPSHSSR